MPREERKPGPWRLDIPGAPIRAAAPVQAAAATVEDVRRAYYDQADVPMTYWITELQMSPPQLIVCDEASANIYRVPVTINGSDITFGTPVPVEREYTDMPAAAKTAAAARWGSPVAARAARPAAPGTRPARGTEEKIAAAVAAGKIPQSRASFYRQMAAHGDDLSVLDTLAAVPGLTAASAPQDPAEIAYRNLFGATSGDGPQPVSAAHASEGDVYEGIFPTVDQAQAAIDAREAAKAKAVAAMSDNELWAEMGFNRPKGRK